MLTTMLCCKQCNAISKVKLHKTFALSTLAWSRAFSPGKPRGCTPDLRGLGQGTPALTRCLGIGRSLARLADPHGTPRCTATTWGCLIIVHKISCPEAAVRFSRTIGTCGSSAWWSTLSTANPASSNALEKDALPAKTSTTNGCVLTEGET